MAGKDTKYGPLLFINSDPSEGGTAPHRRAIYQHVQLKYAKWKRVEDSRKKRASVKAPAKRDIRDENESSDSSSLSSYSTSDDSSESSSLPNAVVRQPPNVRKPRPGQRYLGTPLTILQDGNSDPFGVFAVPVGPKINALMEYSRDYYLPGIQRDANDPGSKVVKPEWAQCVSFLQDKGLAYSHFARIAAVIASDPRQLDVARDFHTQALIFKSKSMEVLQERLRESPEDSKTYNQILLLMNAELYERNFTAASSHAAILVSLLQNGTIKGDSVFLFKVLYHDAQRAAMTLTRPLFDLDHWLPDQIIPASDLVTPQLASAIQSQVLAFPLDICLDYNLPLKRTLATFQNLLICLLLTLKDRKSADAKMVFYGRFHMTISMDRLINHYLDAAEFLTEDTSLWILEDDSIDEAYMSAFISLSTILLLRCLTRIDNVKINGDIALFSANALIIQRLGATIVASARNRSSRIQDKFANAKLYALFIGAWLEQARAAIQRAAATAAFSPDSGVGIPDSEADVEWFNCRFAEQARTMGLYEWPGVKKILQGFIYADVLEPNGAHWFPRIVQTTPSSAF